MSKSKGKRGELELSGILSNYGYDCRRGVQYNGADGSADVVGLKGIHIECKRTERLDLMGALSQAVHDALPGTLPAVFSRKNHSDWLVTMRLNDWIRLYREWELAKDGEND